MGCRKLAVISLRYPKTVILFWVLFLLFFGFYAPKLPGVLKDHGLTPDGAYAKVQQMLSADFHIPEDPVILVFEKKQPVTEAQFRRFIGQTLFRLQGIGGLSEVVSPLEREGMMRQNYAYALLGFEQRPYEMEPVLDEMQRRLPKSGGISVNITGKSAVQADVNRASGHDLRKAERLGIPVAFLILWLAFGGFVSALIPIAVGVIGVIGTMGIMAWLGTKVELSNFVLNVIPMVGLALSIDFALMLVSRFREESAHAAVEQALETTMQTAGRAVLFSAACVFLGLLGTLFIPLPIFRTVAMGAMAVLTVSALTALTLVPALLTVLWPSIQAESKPVSANGKTTVWHAWARYVMKRPVRMGLLASFLLIGCFLPLSKMKVAIPDAASLPPGYASRVAAEAYQAHFVSPSASLVYIVIQGNSHRWHKEDWLRAYAFTQRLERDPNVLRVDSVFSGLRMPPEQASLLLPSPVLREKDEPAIKPFVNENRMLLQVTIKGSPSSKEATDWLRRLEQEGESSRIRFLLGGEAKYQQEVFDAIFPNLKDVLLFIFATQFMVLIAAFRSVLLPVKLMAMNLLSLGAAFGILSWIFEEGRLGMEPGSIAIMIPVFIFGLVFGISMDYGVFLVSRIYEAYRQTHDNDHAIRAGLSSTGRIITSAAAIMIAVTGPFAFGEVAGVKQLGIGNAAAIFIDATVIRMVLVPALMKWLGKWNWWAPRWLQ